MLANRNVAVCFVEPFLRRVAFMNGPFFYQYTSECFGLELRRIPLFTLVQALGSLLANGLGLPVIFETLRGRSEPNEPSECRLNSKFAGLLESSADGMIQFVHQTVKEFMTTPNGMRLIGEHTDRKRSESGTRLIL